MKDTYHVIALWLFDEPQYKNMILTDAGPNRLDLRLLDGGRLVPGKFGNGLHLSEADLPAALYARTVNEAYAGEIPEELASEPVPAEIDFCRGDWTVELWFLSDRVGAGESIVLELRGFKHEHAGAGQQVRSIGFDSRQHRFFLRSEPEGTDLGIPTDGWSADGRWHHLAFSYRRSENQLRHFVDGKLRPLPGKGGLSPVTGEIRSFSLGREFSGACPFRGVVDEMRITGTPLYEADFDPPGTLARRPVISVRKTGAAVPSGLLVDRRSEDGVFRLGGDKHLFIDDLLVDRMENLCFAVNPPVERDVTDFHSFRTIGVIQHGGEIGMYYVMHVDSPVKAQMKDKVMCRAESVDGVHFESTEGNAVLPHIHDGTVFVDTDPSCPPSELFKLVGYTEHRGVHVYTSADGATWRRNEVIAMPFDSGGGVEVFYDDQRDLYAGLLRHEGGKWPMRGTPESGQRSCALAETKELFEPWPFTPIPNPAVKSEQRDRPFVLMPGVTGELPVVIGPEWFDDQYLQVYRSRAVKYLWAPDTYLAFPWRYDQHINRRIGCDLMVSRDGRNWKSYKQPFYFAPDWELDGFRVIETLSCHGILRFGDQLHQYASAEFTTHGKPVYSEDESKRIKDSRLVRYTQRLDGFVSLDTGDKESRMVSHPLLFEGECLVVNARAEGRIRVALLDKSGKPIPGYGVDECDPLTGDGTELEVTWNGKSSVAPLAGKPVRIQIDSVQAKLFGFQFLPG